MVPARLLTSTRSTDYSGGIGAPHALDPGVPCLLWVRACMGHVIPSAEGRLMPLAIRAPDLPCVAVAHTVTGQGVGGDRDLLYLCERIGVIMVVLCQLAGCHN